MYDVRSHHGNNWRRMAHKRIFDAAYDGCYEFAVGVYLNQPNFAATEFAEKVTFDISRGYYLNIMSNLKAVNDDNGEETKKTVAITNCVHQQQQQHQQYDPKVRSRILKEYGKDQVAAWDACDINNDNDATTLYHDGKMAVDDEWELSTLKRYHYIEKQRFVLLDEQVTGTYNAINQKYSNISREDVQKYVKLMTEGTQDASLTDDDDDFFCNTCDWFCVEDDNDDDDEKKPAAIFVYTTDQKIVPSSSSSPSVSSTDNNDADGADLDEDDISVEVHIHDEIMSDIQDDEDRLVTLFAAHNVDDRLWDKLISKDSLCSLMMAERSEQCSHSNTSHRYHITRMMEVLVILKTTPPGIHRDSFLLPLTQAVEQRVDIDCEEANSDPEFSRFLFSTVTNLILIDDPNEIRMFLHMAIEIKYRLQLNLAINSNNEERHGGLRHLYNQKLLKYNRDIESKRGIINICHRETKAFCDCMKPLRLKVKTWAKTEECFGCGNSFLKKELPYCSGCLDFVYCSYECSKRTWVHHKNDCARKNYIRCSTCRVIFPSDELSVHTCIFDHDITF